MYRSGEIYNSIDKVIGEIYIDYNIKEFPINEIEVCNKLGVTLVPYSNYQREGRILLKKKSDNGFFVKESADLSPTIYFNDRFLPKGAIRFTIFHELKHYIYNDTDDSSDDLADYFARHFMCPTAYIMLKGFTSPEEIASFCGISLEAAYYAYAGIENRKKKYGMNLYDYEVSLIKHLEPLLLKSVQYDIMTTASFPKELPV